MEQSHLFNVNVFFTIAAIVVFYLLATRTKTQVTDAYNNPKVQITSGREYYDNWYCPVSSVVVTKTPDKMNMDELELFLENAINKGSTSTVTLNTPVNNDDARQIASRVLDRLNVILQPLKFSVTATEPLGRSSDSLYKLRLTLTERTKFFQLEIIVIVTEDGELVNVATTTSKKFDTFKDKVGDMSTLHSGIGALATSGVFETSLERMTAAHRAKQQLI